MAQHTFIRKHCIKCGEPRLIAGYFCTEKPHGRDQGPTLAAQLQQENKKLNGFSQELVAANLSLTDHVSELRDESAEYKTDNEQLREIVQKIESVNTQWQGSHERLEQENKDLREYCKRVASHKPEAVARKKEIESLKTEKVKLEKRIVNQQNRIENLMRRITNENKCVAGHKPEAVEARIKELEKLNLKLYMGTQATSQAFDRVQELAKVNDQLRAELQELRSLHASERDEGEVVKAALDRCQPGWRENTDGWDGSEDERTLAEKAADAIHDLRRELESERSKDSARRSEVFSAASKALNLSAEVDKLRAELQELREYDKKERADGDHIVKALDSLTPNWRGYIGCNGEKAALAIRALYEEKENREKSEGRARVELREVQKRRAQLDKTLGHKLHECNQVSYERDELRKQRASLDQENLILKTELADYRLVCEELKKNVLSASDRQRSHAWGAVFAALVKVAPNFYYDKETTTIGACETIEELAKDAKKFRELTVAYFEVTETNVSSDGCYSKINADVCGFPAKNKFYYYRKEDKPT